MYSTEIDLFLRRYNYPEFNTKAVLFDMDGVLFDSMKGHSCAWVKAMKEAGLPFTELDVYLNEGQTGTNTINNVFKLVHGREASEEEKNTIYARKSFYFDECWTPAIMPGASELLKKIKSQGLQIVVVTGSGQPSLINNLERHFPGIFREDKMVTAFDVKYGKPDPEPYLKGFKKAGVQPWEVIAVDNAPLGVKSASSAGLFTIGLNTGPLQPVILKDNGADIVFNTMAELNEVWDDFFYKK